MILFDHLPIPVLDLDPEGRIRNLGSPAAALLGFSPGDSVLSHPVLGGLFAKSIGKGVTRYPGVRLEEPSEATFEVIFSPHPHQGVLLALIDSTTLTQLSEELAEATLEGAQVETDLRRSVQNLDLMASVREILTRFLETADLMKELLPILGARLGLSGAAWVAREPFARDESDTATPGWIHPSGIPLAPEEAVRRERWLALPLADIEAAYGTLFFAAETSRAMDRLEPLLVEVAGAVAAALRNIRLHQELKAHGIAVEFLNRELSRAIEDLQEANAFKDRIVSTASHELRTPLTVIRTYAETLLVSGGEIPPIERIKFLRIIVEETGRLSRLIDNLLDLARIEAKREPLFRKETDLVDLVRRTIEPLEDLAREKGLAFRSRLPAVPARVFLDRDQMVRVLTNLVGNAIQYTSRGEIEVVLDEAASPPEGGEDAWLLRIRDTGAGIPDDAREEVFGAFTTLSENGGTGLGLAITRAIVEAHGGKVTLESSLGRGSTFTVSLPKACEAPGAGAEHPGEKERTEAVGGR